MSDNNTCELNFTCYLTKENGSMKFICCESGNRFVYSFWEDASIDDLKHLLKNSQYMRNAFPEFIEDSLNDVSSSSNCSNVTIIREYAVDGNIYSDILKETFIECIEPYFEAFEN